MAWLGLGLLTLTATLTLTLTLTLTKAIYSSLFDWAVRFLNTKLDADKGGPTAPFMGTSP